MPLYRSALRLNAGRWPVLPVSRRIKQYHVDVGTPEKAKQSAAYAAVERYILPGTITIGIGSGSTVPYVVQRIAEQGQLANQSRVFLPTSFQSRQLILAAGLRLADINEHPTVEVTIDGADEIDSELNAIKGGGACHLQEKVVAEATLTWVMIAEAHKRSKVLGTNWRKGIPIEVATFGYVPVMRALARLGATAPEGRHLSLRMGKMKAGPVVTDNGNFVIDAVFPFEHMRQPQKLAQEIKQISGVLEVGLFCGMAKAAVYGFEDGRSEIVESQVGCIPRIE